MQKNHLWMMLIALAATALACNALGGAPTFTPVPRDKIIPPADTTTPQPSYNTKFPLPGDVSNFFEFGGGIVNFQTNISMEDVIAFYRDSFDKEGYTEREPLTVISDTTFSMVFDGHQSGLAIYIQGADVGEGSTNVSIHLGPKE